MKKPININSNNRLKILYVILNIFITITLMYYTILACLCLFFRKVFLLFLHYLPNLWYNVFKHKEVKK